MRKRDPGHMTTDRSAPPLNPHADYKGSTKAPHLYPQGRVTYNVYSDGPESFTNEDVLRPGTIGSEEGRDMQNPAPQVVETVAYSAGETRPQEMHGCDPYPLCAYPEFMPRTSPMPMAGQDEGFLRIGVADSEMTDSVRGMGIPPEQVYKNDLFGQNTDGVAHNEGHPGFSSVASGIAKKEGYSKERASAILAASTRNASASAKRHNPNLKKVKG